MTAPAVAGMMERQRQHLQMLQDIEVARVAAAAEALAAAKGVLVRAAESATALDPATTTQATAQATAQASHGGRGRAPSGAAPSEL